MIKKVILRAASGGTWAMSDPRMLDEVCKYGFNLFNTANNHSGDFGQEGVMATIKHLKERNLVFAAPEKTYERRPELATSKPEKPELL